MVTSDAEASIFNMSIQMFRPAENWATRIADTDQFRTRSGCIRKHRFRNVQSCGELRHKAVEVNRGFRAIPQKGRDDLQASPDGLYFCQRPCRKIATGVRENKKHQRREDAAPADEARESRISPEPEKCSHQKHNEYDERGRTYEPVAGGDDWSLKRSQCRYQCEWCGFRRMRTVIPIDSGQRFRSIADSVPVIADSCSRRRL
jgi:hypothetical protein